jgi:hypothetical protein
MELITIKMVANIQEIFLNNKRQGHGTMIYHNS